MRGGSRRAATRSRRLKAGAPRKRRRATGVAAGRRPCTASRPASARTASVCTMVRGCGPKPVIGYDCHGAVAAQSLAHLAHDVVDGAIEVEQRGAERVAGTVQVAPEPVLGKVGRLEHRYDQLRVARRQPPPQDLVLAVKEPVAVCCRAPRRSSQRAGPRPRGRAAGHRRAPAAKCSCGRSWGGETRPRADPVPARAGSVIGTDKTATGPIAAAWSNSVAPAQRADVRNSAPRRTRPAGRGPRGGCSARFATGGSRTTRGDRDSSR